MPEATPIRADFPTAFFNFTIEYAVSLRIRVLKKMDERRVEGLETKIVYPVGVTEFTVHYYFDDDKQYRLFADPHGWALRDTQVLELIRSGIIAQPKK